MMIIADKIPKEGYFGILFEVRIVKVDLHKSQF